MTYHIHFAWFRRDTGRWLGEWRGLVPAPEIPPEIIGAERLKLMNAWQHRVQHGISPACSPFTVESEAWDLAAWDACPQDGAVCLDVTRFDWPLGDHRWHLWDETQRMLDWPESSMHTFIEVRIDTLDVVANQRSHRPIRSSVPDQIVLDITGTPWAQHYGQIWGTFVWREDEQRWGFKPRETMVGGLPVPPPKALAEAPIDLDPMMARTAVKERVAI